MAIINEAAMASGPDDADARAVDAWPPLLSTKAELHHRIADALTAIMMQAEAARRNATTSLANEADVTSSCEHIVECAKRVWQLITDQQDPSGARVE